MRGLFAATYAASESRELRGILECRLVGPRGLTRRTGSMGEEFGGDSRRLKVDDERGRESFWRWRERASGRIEVDIVVVEVGW
jgi:hypothetical protein